jgi:hypothetical protein
MIGAEYAIEVLSLFTPAGGGGVTVVAGESRGRVWLWDPEGPEAARALVGPTSCVQSAGVPGADVRPARAVGGIGG